MMLAFTNFIESDSVDDQALRGNLSFVFDEHEREDMRQFCCDETLHSNYMLRGQEGLIGLLAHFATHAVNGLGEEFTDD